MHEMTLYRQRPASPLLEEKKADLRETLQLLPEAEGYVRTIYKLFVEMDSEIYNSKKRDGVYSATKVAKIKKQIFSLLGERQGTEDLYSYLLMMLYVPE